MSRFRGALLWLLGPWLLGACSAVQYADQLDGAVVAPQSYELQLPTAAAEQSCRALPGSQASVLLAEVINNNKQVAQAIAQLERAQALTRASGAQLLPRVDAGINAGRGTGVFASSAGMGAPQPLTIFQGSLAASYEIDAWGKLRNEARFALWTSQATAASLESLAITLNASAADGWFALLAQNQLIKLLRAQRDTSRSFSELTLLRFQLGQAQAQDLGRQKLQLLEVERQLELAQSARDILLTQLNLLAGQTSGTLLLDTPADFPPLAELAEPGIPAQLAEARPDVRAARLRLEAADARTAAALALRLPSLNLSATLISIEQTLAELFSDALWSIGAATGANIFDGGALAANVDANAADARAELAAYSQTLLAALQEVQAALISNESQQKVVANLDNQLVESGRVLHLTRNGYRNGLASYLDVLTALLSKQSLERQAIEARRQLFSNRIALCRALGQPVGETRLTEPETNPEAT